MSKYISYNEKALLSGWGNIISRVFMAVFVIFWLHRALYSIEGPASPSVPFVKEPAHQMHTYRVTVVFAHGGQLDGRIHLPSDTVHINVEREGKIVTINEKVMAINEISFNRWKGTDKGSGGYIFNTVLVEVILNRDNARIIAVRIPAFNRFILETSKGKQICFNYYYDYYINGVWKNSGSTEKAYPDTKPHPDTVIKIIFNHNRTESPVGELLKYLSK